MNSWIARRRFEKFNRLYWAGELELPEIVVLPAGMAGRIMPRCLDWGGYEVIDGTPTIELRAVSADVHQTYFNANLIHEMVHHAIGVSYHHRSRRYRSEIRRISGLGALIEVI